MTVSLSGIRSLKIPMSIERQSEQLEKQLDDIERGIDDAGFQRRAVHGQTANENPKGNQDEARKV